MQIVGGAVERVDNPFDLLGIQGGCIIQQFPAVFFGDDVMARMTRVNHADDFFLSHFVDRADKITRPFLFDRNAFQAVDVA